MSDTKFTPGPWARNIKPASHYPTIFAGRSTHIAVLSTRSGLPEDEMEGNCDLIAAGPTMYAALEAIEAQRRRFQAGERGGEIMGALSSAMDLVRDALAKAVGE